MGCSSRLPAGGDKVKKAICWMSEELLTNPQKKREAVIREAEIRFDLSPADCEFLSKNFGKSPPC
ncbi:MAG: hypothetical protein A2505_06370 [Deltaproteobacteria bacterium RIFOXYD12_FULL_55_16]|nr:MAG: hypothetical protein A2505_06370 [Deltaproteobacteria bacterium RIFOXYD12_FULL_55_16]